jgi:hypothetical protein
MDPREQLLTDEFFRYSAECRRLARLARKPPARAVPGIGTTAYLRIVEWIEEIHGRYIEHERRYSPLRVPKST